MIELTPWQVAHPLESLVAMSLAAGKLAEENQRLRANLAGRCSCDGDPIECSHEAARGEAEAQNERLQRERDLAYERFDRATTEKVIALRESVRLREWAENAKNALEAVRDAFVFMPALHAAVDDFTVDEVRREVNEALDHCFPAVCAALADPVRPAGGTPAQETT